MIKNIGWVAGSRGFNSAVSIAYLALAARTLGPAGFGAFALVLTYGQMVANLVQFQSWKGVIRFGALHMAAGRPERLARLFGFTATLDFASAAIGALIAVVCVPLAAPLLHWAEGEQVSAAVFGAVLLLTTGATPVGVLRLFDRFDIVAFSEAVGPMVRLLGCVAAWLVGAGFTTLLWIWAIAAVLQAVTQWVAVLLIHRAQFAFGPSAFRQALDENERVLPFMLQTNISNSVSMFWTQLGTLAVGSVAGPAEAGAFRLAHRLAKGIVRPVQPVTLAVYPELSRLVADGNDLQLRKIVWRVTAVATVLGLCVVLMTGLAGREILTLLAGDKFEFAHKFLFLLSIATALDLSGFALEPVQNAHGRSWNVLRSKIIAAIVYAGLLVVLLPWLGGEGAAVAAVICSLLIFGQLTFLTVRLLWPRHRKAAAVPEHS